MNKKKLSLLALSFIILNGFILGILLFNSNTENTEKKKNISEVEEELSEQPKSPAYTTSMEDNGADINISLHQSYFRDSANIQINTSDNSNNTFSINCPKDANFNSTFINITIEDLFLDNNTIDIYTGSTTTDYVDLGDMAFSSFTVNETCLLSKFSLQLAVTGEADITIYLFNSTWDGAKSVPDTSGIGTADITSFTSVDGWNEVFLKNSLLNNTKTYNNTWFLGAKHTFGGGDADWYYYDGSDNAEFYYGQASPAHLDGNDLLLNVTAAPFEASPYPQNVSLSMNNTAVSGYSSRKGSGYWNKPNTYTRNIGKLNFNLTSDSWFVVTCKIDKIQINYTKKGLKAEANFSLTANSANAFWNVTRAGGFNDYDGLGGYGSNYYINFTIPASWQSVEVWNGSTQVNVDESGPVINGYKNVTAYPAGNGTYWFLNATSPNLLTGNIPKCICTISS